MAVCVCGFVCHRSHYLDASFPTCGRLVSAKFSIFCLLCLGGMQRSPFLLTVAAGRWRTHFDPTSSHSLLRQETYRR